MGLMESYREFLDASKKYQEVSELREKCFKIIQYPDHYSLEEMSTLILDDWPNLFDSFYMHISYRSIKKNFEKLEEGYITRNEFVSKIKDSCNMLDLRIAELKSKVESLEREFSASYNKFFSEGLSDASDLGTKLIYMILLQPEAKEIIMEFLKI